MHDPLLITALAAAVFAAICFVASLATGEHSWVDRLWSIVPILYVGWFALSADGFDTRLALMTVLVAAWGIRLTYNFIRKGGFRPGGEDYRWKVLRERVSPALFLFFNLVFICAVQHALLWLLALPAWVALRQEPTPLGWLDGVAAALFVLFLVGETVADQQQWRFHQEKAARNGAEPRFLRVGLFRYSRHPNFFCEQGLWWALYLFGVAAGSPWLNISLLGPVLLTALFQGSTSFTEEITLSKYPEYAGYQRSTSRLMPRL